MIKYILAFTIGLSGFSLFSFPVSSKATLETHASSMSISISEAKHIVLKKMSGKIIRIRLKREAGNVTYNVDIKRSKDIFRVRVDASSGKILAIQKISS